MAKTSMQGKTTSVQQQIASARTQDKVEAKLRQQRYEEHQKEVRACLEKLIKDYIKDTNFATRKALIREVMDSQYLIPEAAQIAKVCFTQKGNLKDKLIRLRLQGKI